MMYANTIKDNLNKSLEKNLNRKNDETIKMKEDLGKSQILLTI